MRDSLQPLSSSSAETERRVSEPRAVHRALVLAFLALGVVGGAWGAHIPSVKSHYGMTEASLSLALSAAALGALSALFVSGRVVGVWGARRALLVSGVTMQLGLATVLWWPHPWALALALWVLGMSMSVHDVALNAEGTALEARLGRPILGGLHAGFSAGAMLGALAVAGMLAIGWPATHQLLLLGVVLSALVLGISRALRGQGDRTDRPANEPSPAGRDFVWPRGPLLGIGLLIFAGMLSEGVMYDWSVLHLQQSLEWTQDRAALGYAVFAGAMACTRAVSDRARSRWGDGPLLWGSAVVACLGMALTLAFVHPLVSLLGYAAVGMGLAPVVPLLYAAAARVPGSSSAAALAAVSSIGYAGFVVGPPWIGFLADTLGLATALWTIVVATAALALGAQRLQRLF